MAVAEYVRGKTLQNDTPAPQSSNHVATNPSRELVANMARLKVPTTRLSDRPRSAAGTPREHQLGTATRLSGQTAGYHVQHSQATPRDMFDTDVETVDDSTTTATSLIREEEGGVKHDFQVGPPAAQRTAQDENDLPSNVHYSWGNPRGRNALEERMIMELGSDPGGDEHDAIQVPQEHDVQHVRFDAVDENEFDGDAAQIFDWSSNHHINGEPLSWQKIEAALHDTKAPPTAQGIQRQENIEEQSVPRQSDYENYPDENMYTPKATQKHSTDSRFVTRSRFSTPNPRGGAPLEGGILVGSRPIPQISPSRTVILSPQSQPVAQSSARNTIGPNKPNPLHVTHDNHDPYSHGGLFDITDLSAVDSSSSENSTDNQHTYTSLGFSTLSPVSTKRSWTELQADYPPNILETKTFADLQAESFDYNPAPPQPIFQPQDPPLPLSEKLTRLKALTDEQRHMFFASLNIAEWEESGDWIIDQFSLLLQRTKAARHERRKVAAVFEREIERRYELVEAEGKGIGQRLEEMRTGGMDVLKGQAL
ncbi:hypothetical protein BDBG_07126 [Blastomyces gilchristii SLH14081]|uniref:Extracellular mutant protein 11 C-terminal domain-containing protein n=1 Tax=Blastomyces gilchristii (strain SLH14081) TaxID=559298 RepID=A0A179UUG5_BLAGS|nr:uncharacterized protein BDBG_07126 [Blastomyces gilchristii SLH14081]OAT11684.1 hypothetical protein BDBG_07126 [Blastomyces gilchristii SLH14081]